MYVGQDEKVTSYITNFKASEIQHPVFVLLFLFGFYLQQWGAEKISLAIELPELVSLWRV